jgi:hypothetical protein
LTKSATYWSYYWFLTAEMQVVVWLEVNKAKYDGKQRLKTLDQGFIPET